MSGHQGERLNPGTRVLLAVFAATVAVAGCSRNPAVQQVTPSTDDAWVQAACSPAFADFGSWPRRTLGPVTVAVPPGYGVEQGPQPSIRLRGPSGQTWAALQPYNREDAQQTYDAMVLRPQQKRHACRTTLSGHTADVIATYDQGQYRLTVLWNESAWGDRTGKWLVASITGPRLEEVQALRSVLHSLQPATTR